MPEESKWMRGIWVRRRLGEVDHKLTGQVVTTTDTIMTRLVA